MNAQVFTPDVPRLFRPGRPGRIFPLLLGLTVLLTFFSACSNATSNAPASKPTVVIGYENNGADPEMIALAQNLFSKDLNANVKLQYFDSGPAALAAIASGALQIMTGIGNPPTVSAIARGVPLQVIWAQELYTLDEGLVVRNGSGIHSLKDLAGKTVALVVGSTSPFALNAALVKAGVNPASVHFVNTTPPAIRTAWANKSIDAAYVWDPVFDTISHEDATILLTDQDIAQEAPIFNLAIANTTWAQQNPALAKAFVQAEDAAVTFYKQNPEQGLQQMASQAGIAVDLARTEIAGYQIYSAQDQLGPNALGEGSTVATSLVTKSLSAAADYLHSIGTLSTIPTNLAQYVNPTYVEQALGKS